MSTEDLLYFWDQQTIVELGGALPIMMGKKVTDFRGKWSGRSAPSMSAIRDELSSVRLCCAHWRSNQDGDRAFVDIMAGRLFIPTSVTQLKDGLRLFLVQSRGVTAITHRDKSRILRGCARIRVRGASLVTAQQMTEDFEKVGVVYSTGTYVRMIRDAQPIAEGIENNDAPQIDDSGSEPIPAGAEEAAFLLRQITESAHEVEEQIALAEPPFQYIERHAEPHRGNLKQFFRLKLPTTDHRRLVDKKVVMLERTDPLNGDKILLRVENLAAGTDEIVVSSQRQIEEGDMPGTGELRLSTNPLQKNIRESVINTLLEGRSPNQWLLPAIACTREYGSFSAPDVPPPPGARPMPSQQDAINRATGSPDLFLVLGPPGTGKTTVILAWVRHLVAQGKRVLVTSQSNKAVDNVLERLARDAAIQCVRLGHEGKVSSSVQRYLIDNCAADLQEKFLANVGKALADIETCTQWARDAERVLVRDAAYFARLRPLREAKEKTSKAVIVAENARNLTDAAFAEAERSASVRRSRLAGWEARQARTDQATSRNPFRIVWGWIIGVMILYTRWSVRSADKSVWMSAVKRIDASADHEAISKEYQGVVTQLGEVEARLMSSLPAVPEVGLPIRFSPWRHIDVSGSSDMVRAFQTDRDELGRLTRYITRWRNAVGGGRQEALYSQLIAAVDVVGATCIGIHTSAAFREVEFDVVIADECGQIQIHDLMVPLARAPKAIMVGDHKQLPPVVTPELKEALSARYIEQQNMAENSWFEYMWDNLPDSRRAVLDTQFRCPAVISDYISEAFYEGQYHAGPGVKETPLFTFFTSPLVFIDTSKHPRRGEANRKNIDRLEVLGNRLETEIVMTVLERALAEKPEIGREGEVGIIAPYANHVAEIQRVLSAAQKRDSSAVTELSLPVRDVVASVDSFQGQERKLIIVALSRCNPDGIVGFLSDWRRINVAMTRTKHQLVMVGDLATLTKRRKQGGQGHDDEFKTAMLKLKDHVAAHGQMIPASVFVSA